MGMYGCSNIIPKLIPVYQELLMVQKFDTGRTWTPRESGYQRVTAYLTGIVKITME